MGFHWVSWWQKQKTNPRLHRSPGQRPKNQHPPNIAIPKMRTTPGQEKGADPRGIKRLLMPVSIPKLWKSKRT